MQRIVHRNLTPVVRELIEHFRIVEIQGARQSGKTTLAEQIAVERGGRLVSLDDRLLRASAQADPVNFVEQLPDGLLVIAELQRVPALVLTLSSPPTRINAPAASSSPDRPICCASLPSTTAWPAGLSASNCMASGKAS